MSIFNGLLNVAGVVQGQQAAAQNQQGLSSGYQQVGQVVTYNQQAGQAGLSGNQLSSSGITSTWTATPTPFTQEERTKMKEASIKVFLEAPMAVREAVILKIQTEHLLVALGYPVYPSTTHSVAIKDLIEAHANDVIEKHILTDDKETK